MAIGTEHRMTKGFAEERLAHQDALKLRAEEQHRAYVVRWTKAVAIGAFSSWYCRSGRHRSGAAGRVRLYVAQIALPPNVVARQSVQHVVIGHRLRLTLKTAPIQCGQVEVRDGARPCPITSLIPNFSRPQP
jgi:hypothetical protein